MIYLCVTRFNNKTWQENKKYREKKNIEVGKRNFGKVSVITGVSEGDQVITEGVSKVRNKAKVKILKVNNKK